MTAATLTRPRAVEIRVRGRVQGVGFRPLVWHEARALGLAGEVRNEGADLLIRAAGDDRAIDTLVARLRDAPPTLARITAIERREVANDIAGDFRIVASAGTAATGVTPDARLCDACAAEIVDPFARRFRYPFTTCTACGPRFSIVTAAPYDRAATTMARFPLCPDCAAEYRDPADRRFHAEAIACHRCGPAVRLVRLDGRAMTFDQHSPLDDVDAAGSLLRKGAIVAIKGLGGYQLACDAANEDVVARLRAAKQRDAKPFALMARDLTAIRRHAIVDDAAARLLAGPEGPIVLLPAAGEALPDAVAPHLTTLGFMLPTSPLHALLLRRLDHPVVMTSGNLSGAPQIVDDEAALAAFAGIAEYALVHDRPIAHRIDDSVIRPTARGPVLLRRARGYVPDAIPLPPGFETAPPVLAYGGELKATFCLASRGHAVLSGHHGDLDHPDALAAFRAGIAAAGDAPAAIAADRHPDYHATRLACDHAAAHGLPLEAVQHHHAHVAACLIDNGRPLDAAPVLGVVLDGLGYGDDGSPWGGEFLRADYRGAERLATLKPVPLLGGDQAAREPWRALYAHLMAAMSWAELTLNFSELPLHAWLATKPRDTLDAMVRRGLNAPLASSGGRLFDAVAAALGVCRERQAYEGEAAMRLEALVCPEELRADDTLAYPFTFPNLAGSGLPYVEPQAMWHAILGDLILDTPVPVMAARFHKGLARAITRLAERLAARDAGTPRFDTVALSGGCFQNRVLLEQTADRLEAAGFAVLTHGAVPPNDAGLSLGQAVVAAARHLQYGRA